jgi:hypothetical protein
MQQLGGVKMHIVGLLRNPYAEFFLLFFPFARRILPFRGGCVPQLTAYIFIILN